MRKLHLIMILALLPALFLACGSGETPESDANTPVEDIEVLIVNDLGDLDISGIKIDPSDGPWGENRIDTALDVDDEITITLHEENTYDIMITDEEGDTYTLWNVEIDENGFEWAVTLDDGDWNIGNEEVTVTIENGLASWTLLEGYCNLSDNDAWSEDRFGSSILEPGESVSFEVASGNYYDLKCVDNEEDVYILWDVWVDESGFVWEVDLADIVDNSDVEAGTGDEVAVTVYNGLEDWTIQNIYGDPSDGPWGEDRLGTELLEPGDEFVFYVPAGAAYDFKVVDEENDTYTLWNVEVDEGGYYWNIEISDLDI